jgi:hypothetical protein
MTGFANRIDMGKGSHTERDAIADLNIAAAEFFELYEKFAKRGNNFIVAPTNAIQKAMQLSSGEHDVTHSAEVFGDEIAKILDALVGKDIPWTSKVGHFMKRLYPIASISLRLTSSVSEVICILPTFTDL